jgi:hypothetical protein
MDIPVAGSRRVPRSLSSIAILLCCLALPGAGQAAAALERGLAITDPLALRELDLREHRAGGLDPRGFGIRDILSAARSGDGPMRNDALFALPAMAPVRKTIDAEFNRYVARHKADLPKESIGVGASFDVQLFDRAALYSGETRFVLAGIVNRMDRAYVAPATCGEIRLIYRLARVDGAKAVDSGTGSSRLPMTLNAVFHARGRSSSVTCAEIARRWLATSDLPQSSAELALRLLAPGGPLELLRPENLFRIEFNLQIAHAPKSAVRDFRTDYLLKVFDYDKGSHAFDEVKLENQVDRARLLSDPALASAFRTWLLMPDHLAALDRGTLIVPDEFLGSAALAPTPVGFAPSDLQPAFGLVGSDDDAKAVFRESDVVTALEKASEGIAFRNIRSIAGFERRLNDITCAGCHQTRGIGGFHFPGVDWMAAKPDNSVVVPASPHFFGDQARRRDILLAMRDGRTPDFSRGFSDRPQVRGSKELAGTEYDNGWGATCYDSGRNEAPDASFRAWTCAKGLACQVTGKAKTTSHIGMCFVGAR